MQILNITDINKKESPLHYRNEYDAVVVYSTALGEVVRVLIHFIVEKDSAINRKIEINFKTNPGIPIDLIVDNLKSYIYDLDYNFKLP